MKIVAVHITVLILHFIVCLFFSKFLAVSWTLFSIYLKIQRLICPRIDKIMLCVFIFLIRTQGTFDTHFILTC